jgi:hypothetical protein
MNLKNMLLGAGAAIVLSSLSAPAFAQSVVRVGESEYPVLEELPVMIYRNELGLPVISYTEKSEDKRYRLVEVLPALTQELPEGRTTEVKTLYRLAEVYDKEERMLMTVALPIVFDPPLTK